MEQSLSVLIVLVLVWSCRGWEAPDFCHQQQCPQYQVVGSHQGFEERLYVATDWITTKVDSPEDSDVMAAYSRLKHFCQRQKEAGNEIPTNTWPALITVSEGENGPDLSMSWFVPPGTTKPENTDPSVTVQSRPEATVYVRIFAGTPSISSGETNAKMLQEALDKAGKTFDPHTYTGAGYDSYLSITHHNEIWIYPA
ncbi:heme-binding protein 2-like [Seriola aureovittata]|uniref:heme-binding protein 2-like n=1 Tax=Seriola aureovittata TaxID=2871759 RepID=UPI0024BE2054|nr:heme-binding protein 2-like [Seriola aureovittata]XP_056251990.1 heme-binding protein 2-like [Seriola aureovittata]